MTDSVVAGDAVSKCPSCQTELAGTALACPACCALVYGGVLKQLAATAEGLAANKDLVGARDAWSRALSLLPDDTEQHAAICGHVTALNAAIAKQAAPATPAAKPSGPPWKRGITGAVALALVALGKLKFLLLGLTKVSTFISMFAFFGVYWNAFGWPLALGLVVSIYIHEMGHVAELRRLGINAGAPLFIPGLGALVRLKQHIDDPVVDARIGLAGPIWGLGAGIAAWLVALVTSSHAWFAIAQLTGYINLFNLIPIWQLDGSRGFHALDRVGRWIVVGATLAAFALTTQRLLLIIAGVGVYRAFTPSGERTDRRTLATFVTLIVALTALSAIRVRA